MKLYKNKMEQSNDETNYLFFHKYHVVFFSNREYVDQKTLLWNNFSQSFV